VLVKVCLLVLSVFVKNLTELSLQRRCGIHVGVKLNFRLKKWHDLYLLVQITKITVKWSECPYFFIQMVSNQFNISVTNINVKKRNMNTQIRSGFLRSLFFFTSLPLRSIIPLKFNAVNSVIWNSNSTEMQRAKYFETDSFFFSSK